MALWLSVTNHYSHRDISQVLALPSWLSEANYWQSMNAETANDWKKR